MFYLYELSLSTDMWINVLHSTFGPTEINLFNRSHKFKWISFMISNISTIHTINKLNQVKCWISNPSKENYSYYWTFGLCCTSTHASQLKMFTLNHNHIVKLYMSNRCIILNNRLMLVMMYQMKWIELKHLH